MEYLIESRPLKNYIYMHNDYETQHQIIDSGLSSTRTMLTQMCSWWRHQMGTFSALLAICAGNSPVPGEFPTQRPVSRRSDVFFDLRLNIWLSKQSWGWWFETLSHPLWCHCNVKCALGKIWVHLTRLGVANLPTPRKHLIAPDFKVLKKDVSL